MSNPHCAYPDALIDAEQLRWAKAEDVGAFESLVECGRRHRTKRWDRTLLGKSEWLGDMVAFYSGSLYPGTHICETSAAYFARESAHAAFRAIPALKEE